MSFKINSNIASMNATTQFNRAFGDLANSLNKLSTGRRINKAADDASGMSIADSLKSQTLGMGQAIRNANDAINITQIADGALEESVNIINTIKTKAVQAANGSQSVASRQAIQADINNLMKSLDGIAQNTSFNGQKLLGGDFTSKQFQIGPNSGETIDLSIESTEAAKLGDLETGSLTDIDVTTFEGAQDAMTIADAALQQVNAARSNIGSTQNQLTSTINNLQNTRINVAQSESTIRDIDYAEESMNMTRLNNLTKIRSFAAAQANANQKRILDLLG